MKFELKRMPTIDSAGHDNRKRVIDAFLAPLREFFAIPEHAKPTGSGADIDFKPMAKWQHAYAAHLIGYTDEELSVSARHIVTTVEDPSVFPSVALSLRTLAAARVEIESAAAKAKTDEINKRNSDEVIARASAARAAIAEKDKF